MVTKKHTFPVPGCSSCPYHQEIGGLTRYCSGFKRRKPKRFRSSDPKFKAPKWCPRRFTPPTCRVYGFADDCAEYMELLRRLEYESGRSKVISPSPGHYRFKAELALGMTATQFFDAMQEETLGNILPENLANGEIIGIDDGLQAYYFYVLDYATIVPLPYFRLTKGDATK